MDLKIRKYLRAQYSGSDDSFDVFIKSIAIVALFWLSVFCVYVFPVGVDKLFFAILMGLFWISKKDYFWFAFFIIISYNPAGFFQESSAEDLRRLPLFNIIPRASMSVMDLFLVLALIKAISKGRKTKYKDVLGIKSIFVFMFYLLIISLMHGFSIKTFISQPLRGIFSYTIFFSFPALVKTRKDTFKFMYMFFPFVFQELFAQCYLLYTGQYIQSLFNADTILIVFRDKLMFDSIRSLAHGYAIVVMSYVFCMIVFDSIDRMSSKPYLIMIMITSAISVLISATRQTILMFAFMFILYVFFVTKNKKSFVVQLTMIGLLLFLIFDYMNILDINYTLNASLNRLTGAVQMQNGSLEAEDTLEFRLAERFPILWDHIKHSLLLGYGFSDEYFIFYDGHLGGILIGMLQAGILGLMFYMAYVVKLYKVIMKYIRVFGDKISMTSTLKSSLVGMSGFFFLNIFINPMIVLNFQSRPQEFFILIVLVTQFINFGRAEYLLKSRLKYGLKPETKPDAISG